MENNELHKLMDELALALLYLSSRQEKYGEQCAWKGIDFGVLDRLQEQKYIGFTYKAKSLSICE